MIRTTPLRLTILQCSQRTLIDGRTFTDSPHLRLRLALPSQTRLTFGCGSHSHHRLASPSAAAPETGCGSHSTISLLLEPVRDPAAREVVRRQLDLHAVPGQDANEVHAHLAADVR